MEKIYKQSFEITDLVTDRFGKLKLSAPLFYAQEIAGQHCNLLGTDFDSLAKHGLFWAVTRHRVQITRMPVRGETITVETWPMPTTRVAYPRAVAAYDAEGKELFRIISLWVLMDINKRTMVLPGKSSIEVAGILRGTELETPSSLVPQALPSNSSRQVTFSCLDRNGHMNNTKYLDWISDLLDSDFHRDHTAKEYTICYLSEALEKQQISLAWQLSQEGILQVHAHREETDVSKKQTRVFSAQLVF